MTKRVIKRGDQRLTKQPPKPVKGGADLPAYYELPRAYDPPMQYIEYRIWNSQTFYTYSKHHDLQSVIDGWNDLHTLGLATDGLQINARGTDGYWYQYPISREIA